MADTFTDWWGLTKPEVGASRDSWGAKLNSDLDAIDALLLALQPVGAMTDFAGFFAPYGWVLCDGSLYPIATYPRLFAVISNAYGGDGVTTFAVPDARGRVMAGAGSTIGDFGYTTTITTGMRFGDYAAPIFKGNLPAELISTSPAGSHGHPGSVTDIQGNHVHAGSTTFDGDHNHVVTGMVAFHNGDQQVAGGPDSGIQNQITSTDGNHRHTFSTTVNGDHQHNVAVSGAGDHTHTFSLGNGAPFRVLQAGLGTTKIICTGPPTMQTTPADVPDPDAPLLLTSPMRGIH